MKRWRCPKCQVISKSPDSTRSRYCAECSAWCSVVEERSDEDRTLRHQPPQPTELDQVAQAFGLEAQRVGVQWSPAPGVVITAPGVAGRKAVLYARLGGLETVRCPHPRCADCDQEQRELARALADPGGRILLDTSSHIQHDHLYAADPDDFH